MTREKMSDTIKTISLEPNDKYVQVGTNCIICNDTIILSEYNIRYNRILICDKCKAAILKVRREMEEKNE